MAMTIIRQLEMKNGIFLEKIPIFESYISNTGKDATKIEPLENHVSDF